MFTKLHNDRTKIRYFDIVWLSTVDGPNTRVTLFLSGCNLRCPWCHSPHSWSGKRELLFFANRCSLCGSCLESCPENAHKIFNNVHTIDRDKCIQCGKCIDNCPNSSPEKWKQSALGFAVREQTVSDLFRLLEPQLLMLKNNGGLTVSGGEPLLQSEAVTQLLILCKEQDINTAIETSLSMDFKIVNPLLNLVDYWLVGLRPVVASHKNKLKIGRPALIEKNISLLCSNGSDVTIRLPLIPNYTDNKESWQAVKNVMEKNGIKNIDLIPYNYLASHYYNALGMEFPLKGNENPKSYNPENAADYFNKYQFNGNIISGGVL